eukprot:125013-Rhodomonas_salina.1
MPMQKVAKITIDDAVACIVPDGMAGILAMDAEFECLEQTDSSDMSTAPSCPVSVLTFEPQPEPLHLSAEAPCQSSPQDDNTPAKRSTSSARRQRAARPRKTDRRAVAWTAEEHEIFLR